MTEISNDTLRETLVKMADRLHLPTAKDDESQSIECLDLDELRESLRLAGRRLAEAESDRMDADLARQWFAARIEGLRKARALVRHSPDDGAGSDTGMPMTMAGLIHHLTDLTASLRCLSSCDSSIGNRRFTPGNRDDYRAFKS